MDGFGNTTTSFNGTATLSDITGTINPGVTGSFASGVWTGSVTITKNQPADRITVTSGNKTGTSNNFDVNPRSVDHFRIQTINSPQIAGQKFVVTITAEDQYNNTVTSFNDFVNLSDPTGTITPSSTKNFTLGQVTDSVSITKSQQDIRITASRNTAIGYSNYFNVEPAPLDRFTIANISTQAAGEPFTITVTARDFYNNRVSDFSGTVDIFDLTNTITPIISGNFDAGRWSGSVTITKVMNNNQISVTRSGGAQTGSSNFFDVEAGSIDHFEVSDISGDQTAGVPFSITITAKDANIETVTGYTGTANLQDLTGTL